MASSWFLGPWSVQWFARRYSINMTEAEFPIENYLTIGKLFTRRLKSGLRPIKDEVVHPSDSMLMQRGAIVGGQLLQIKGRSYSLEELIHVMDGSHWEGGSYLNYYLCPTDYHRVHSPVRGEVKKVVYIPGSLWPVNQWSVSHVPRLFARNERLVIYIQTDRGEVALIMVGATNVGKMTLSFDSELITNQPGDCSLIRKPYDPSPHLEPGDEVGVFHMGSTVVMLYPPQFFGTPVEDSGAPLKVKVGESLSKSLGL